MFKNKNIWVIIIVILAIIMIYYIFFAPSTNNVNSVQLTENFTKTFYNHPNKLNDYYVEKTNDIQQNVLDKLVCDPSCCGSQWPVPFDGLTAEQIQRTLSDQKSGGPFVRTSYSCANGPNGVGCPCVTPQAYLNLANRGQNTDCNPKIENSLLVQPNKLYDKISSYITEPNEWLDGSERINEQVLVDRRKINDAQIRRHQANIDDVRAYGN